MRSKPVLIFLDNEALPGPEGRLETVQAMVPWADVREQPLFEKDPPPGQGVLSPKVIQGIADSRPDALIVDLDVLDEDKPALGVDLIKRLRSHRSLGGVPVFVLSDFAESYDVYPDLDRLGISRSHRFSWFEVSRNVATRDRMAYALKVVCESSSD